MDELHFCMHHKHYLVVDGCRDVNQHYGDLEKAIRQIENAGAKLFVSVDAVL